MAPEVSTGEKVPEQTPAEIAKELEKKATQLDIEGKKAEATRKRELAKKVRASETVTGTTEIKLQSLQSGLSDLEQKDLKEARNMAVGVATTAGLAVVATSLVDKMDNSALGNLGIKDSIKKWLTETLAEEPGEDADFLDKIMHNITKMFLTPFAKMFGVDLKGKKEWEGGDSEDEKKKKQEDAMKENRESQMNTLKYEGTTKVLIEFYSSKKEKTEKWKVQNVFLQKKFQALTLTEATTYYEAWKASNYSFLEKLQIDSSIIKDDDIREALRILVTWDVRKFIEKKYSEDIKNEGKSIWWETLYSLVQWLHQDVAHFWPMLDVSLTEVDKIREHIAFWIHKKEDGDYEVSGSLKEKAVWEMWLTKNLLVYMWLRSNHKILNTPDNLIKTIEWENHWLEINELKDMKEKIIPFAFKIQEEILKNKKLNLWVNFWPMLQKTPLMFSEIIKIYIVTGGKNRSRILWIHLNKYDFIHLW